jgi:hypothetical protein
MPGGPPSPKASLALDARLEEVLECVIDEAELVESAPPDGPASG